MVFNEFFFEKQGLRKTILKNTIWLAFGEGISRIFTVFLLLYVARILGPGEFGVFSFALSIVTIFVIFSDFGLTDITTREFARDRNSEQEYSGIVSLKIILSIIVFIFIAIISFFIVQDQKIQKIILILAAYMLMNNFLMLIYAFFRARQQMQYEALIRVVQAVFMAGLGFYFVSHFQSAEAFSYVLFGTTFLVMIFVVLAFSIFIKPISIIFAPTVWKKFLLISWPLGLAMMFGVIYIRIDSVMMGFWGQIIEVGWYNAAHRTMGLAVIPMILISLSFYPALSRLFKESKEKLQRTWNILMEIMILLAIPITMGGIIFAPELMDFLYTKQYEPAVLAFQILIVVAGLNFLYNPYGIALVISDQQKKHLYAIASAAFLNIFLNFMLIPRYSLYGAAVATLITYILLLVLEVEFVRRFTPISIFNIKLLKTFFISLTLTIIMVFVVKYSFISNLHILFQIGMGIVVYGAAIFALYVKGFIFRFN